MTEVEAARGEVVQIIEAGLWFREEVRLITWVATLDHTLAWYQGRVLTGWSLRKKEDEWLMVVKVNKRGRGDKPVHQVAFFRGMDLMETFKALAFAIRRDLITWKQDKYADKG